MNTKEQIEGLKRLLYREAAISLLNFQRAMGEHSRSWDDLTQEEQQGRMDFAADFLQNTEDQALFAHSGDDKSAVERRRLTVQQRVALEAAAHVMQEVTAFDRAKVIQAMLSQSVPAWQVTDERIAAIRDAIETAEHDSDYEGELRASLGLDDDKTRALRAMLAEVELVTVRARLRRGCP